MGETVEAFIELYRSLGVDGEACSTFEVQEVERGVGLPLPASYKAYLRVAGRHMPAAWVGSDCTIGRLPKLQEWGPELLRECDQPPLPAQAFVFLMHQGYQFFYFLADGSSDDPPVFYYLEGEPAVVRKFDRLSDLVASCVGERPGTI